MLAFEQEFYKEKLTDEDGFRERFYVVAEATGVARKKAAAKLDADKARQLPAFETCFIQTSCWFRLRAILLSWMPRNRERSKQILSGPCCFNFTNQPIYHAWPEAEGPKGQNNFEFLLGCLASFAADLPTCREITVLPTKLSQSPSPRIFIRMSISSVPGSLDKAERPLPSGQEDGRQELD